MSPGPGTGLQGPALLQNEMKMLLDTSSLAETLTVVTVFISLAAICVNLVVIGTLSLLIQSRHWRSRHPALLWLSVSLADIITATTIIITRIIDSRSDSWLHLVTRLSSYCSIISVSSLSLDKMLSVARPFTYTLHRGQLMGPILICIWVGSGGVALLNPPLGLALVFLPSCLLLVPCQLYLYVVASRHYRNIQQVKRCIAAKEVSDNAFLSCNISCTPISAVKLGTTSHLRTQISSHRWILFTTCSVFLLTWLPHLLCGLVKAGAGLVELSLVSLTSGLLTTPIVHPGQNKELQQVLKRIIRKPELENCELGILPIGEQPGKNEVQQENNEWWAVLRLQVTKLGKSGKMALKEVETKHSADIFSCLAPECAGTGV